MLSLVGRSFRRKMFLHVALTTGSALCIACAAVVLRDWIMWDRAVPCAVGAPAALVSAGVAGSDSLEDVESAQRLLNALAANPSIRSAVILRPDGSVFAQIGHDKQSPRVGFSPEQWGSSYDRGDLVYHQPITFNGQVLGSVYLRYSLSYAHGQMLQNVLIIAAVMSVCFAAALIVSRRFQDSLLRPIRELQQTAKAVSDRRDYSVRAKKLSDDEIGALADVFNNMLEEIQYHDVALKQSRAKLQQRVAERTMELANANKGLKKEIAERKIAQEELRQAKEAAETATIAKSEFLANMSHEIRTPMTAILGFAENIIDPDFTEDERHRAVDTILRNGEHLLEIINGILDLSKIEAGICDVERVKCNPNKIIVDICSLMQVRAEEKGLALSVQFDGPIPETIESDPTRIGQILVNLIGNAIKFTETGSVKLIARLVGGRAQEYRLEIDIVDTGIGMSEEHISRIFHAFTQGDASMTRRFGGTGLGLSMSKRLAEMLGGNISVSSELGSGSTFKFSVSTGPLDNVKMLSRPITTVALANRELVTEHSPLLNCRVLLVEDGPDNQKLIGHILRKAGAQVEIAENGQVAVDRIICDESESDPQESAAAVDIILMDMQMPVMDGYEATTILRRNGYTKPIVALTAHAMTGDREKCIDAGCDDYVTKPIKRRTLIETVQEHLHRRSLAPSE